MSALTYTIGNTFFPTQQALQQYVSKLLHRHIPPYRLHRDDGCFMMELLERHPSAETKIGCGVQAIWIKRNGKFGNGFYVERTDGTWEDFSYKQCLRPFTHASKCKFAFRRAIDPQVNAIKQSVFYRDDLVLECSITGELMTWETAHVDHIPPHTFAALLTQFLELYRISFDDIELREPLSGIGKLLPPDIEAQWAIWHGAHARLRVISADANLRLVR